MSLGAGGVGATTLAGALGGSGNVNINGTTPNIALAAPTGSVAVDVRIVGSTPNITFAAPAGAFQIAKASQILRQPLQVSVPPSANSVVVTGPNRVVF